MDDLQKSRHGGARVGAGRPKGVSLPPLPPQGPSVELVEIDALLVLARAMRGFAVSDRQIEAAEVALRSIRGGPIC